MDKKLLTRKEYDLWQKTIPSGVCTFCPWENEQIVLKVFENWVWIANLAPYWRYHTLILPKRHFTKFSDMTFKEAGELPTVIDYGEKKILDAKLLRTDGSVIDKVIYFWRFRFNRFDPISETVRPDHWHLHLVPDRDHSFDPTLDETASMIDISVLK